METGARTGLAITVMLAQPACERLDIGVAPHPGREAPKGGLRVLSRRLVADVAVDRGGVGPVRLDRDDREAMLLDQPPRNRGARAVELRRTVARFAEQDDTGTGEPIERFAEGRVGGIRQRFRRFADARRQSIVHRQWSRTKAIREKRAALSRSRARGASTSIEVASKCRIASSRCALRDVTSRARAAQVSSCSTRALHFVDRFADMSNSIALKSKRFLRLRSPRDIHTG